MVSRIKFITCKVNYIINSIVTEFNETSLILPLSHNRNYIDFVYNTIIKIIFFGSFTISSGKSIKLNFFRRLSLQNSNVELVSATVLGVAVVISSNVVV